ncbi:MAG TPA: DUF512 domain-containing protein [Chloroflexota bacterium]|nr:DUF512 domain-containing protein [Chloroflexota bacterium]
MMMQNEIGPVGGVVSSVDPGSIAEACGMLPGDRLLEVNGCALRDVIDYRYASGSDDLTLLFLRGEEEHEVEVERDWEDELGIQFETPIFDRIRQCRNRCCFCFVKNLPKGMRSSLYIRDDDYRLSFLFGNFVTLSNVDVSDLERIAEQRLSPLYVSVHATDRTVRNSLLGVDAPDILSQIEDLGRRGVRIHAQIVLCPGINDGEQLTATIEDLAARQDTVLSAAVVPIGLTRFCQNREMRLFSPSEARGVVERVTPLQKRFKASIGRRFVHLSDEFYVMSGIPVPPASWYDGFPQLDNGVGMVRRLLSSWASSRRRLPAKLDSPRRVGWICGTSAYPTLSLLAADIMNRVDGLHVELHQVQNRFFGTSVTVSGLLTGADVLDTIKQKHLDCWVLPRVMFDDAGDRTLDGVTLKEIRETVPDPVRLADSASELMRLSVRGE